MNTERFLKDYFQRYKDGLFDTDVSDKLVAAKELLLKSKRENKKVYIAGNGASASIASHVALDYTKQAKVPTVSFNEASFVTAFANDFGYENWVARAFEHYAMEGDTLILISSSGKSPNIVNAANYAKNQGITTITFSGFEKENPLAQVGDLNFWVDSKAYNIIEHIHSIWLLTICDLIMEKAEYSVA